MKNFTDQDYSEFFASTDKYSDAKLLYETTGAEMFSELIQYFGGDALYIPKLNDIHRMHRNKEIKELYQTQGLSIKEIANKYGVTLKTIYNVLNEKQLNK